MFIAIVSSKIVNKMEKSVKMTGVFFPLNEQLQQLHFATSIADCV